MKLYKNRKAALALTAALTGAVFVSCSDQDFSNLPDTSVSQVGRLAVSGSLYDDTDVDEDVSLTLTLSGTSFLKAIPSGTDLTPFISVYAKTAEKGIYDAVAATKVVAAADIAAEATSAQVMASMVSTISGDALEDNVSGSFYVTVKGDKLSGGTAVAGSGGNLELGASPVSGAIAITRTGGSSSAVFNIDFSGKLAGYDFAGTKDDISVEDVDIDRNSVDHVSLIVTAAEATGNGVKVTVSGNAVSTLTEQGRVAFTIPYSAITKNETAYAESGSKTFVSSKGTYMLTGVEATADDISATGYGTVAATVTTDSITISLSDDVTFNTNATADEALTAISYDSNGNISTIVPSFTDWSVSGNKATFKLAISKDLASSDEDFTGSVTLSINGSATSLNDAGTSIPVRIALEEHGAETPAAATVSYALNYKSYLAMPNPADIVTVSTDTTATVLYTNVNLGAYGKSFAAVAKDAVVAEGTIGETAVTAKAIAAASAGSESIPVAITYTGTAPTGGTELTVPAVLVSDGNAVTIKQTDARHLVQLAFIQDYESAESAADTGWGVYVNTFASTTRGTVTLGTDNTKYFAGEYHSETGNNGCFFTSGTSATANSLYDVATGTDFVLSFDAVLPVNSSATSGFGVSNAAGYLLTTSNNPQGCGHTVANSLLWLQEKATSSTVWTINADSTQTLDLDGSTWYRFIIKRVASTTSLKVINLDDNSVIFDDAITSTTSGGLGQIAFSSNKNTGTFKFDNAYVLKAN